MQPAHLSLFSLISRMTAIVAISSLGLAARCGVEPQKGEVYSADGQAFEKLADLANPKPTEQQLYELRANQSDDAVRIAVIDNGVDYMHPGLIGQIDFEPDLAGAGFDVMGSDRWAHANLINPALFAFAGSVSGPRIVESERDALELLSELNADFGRRLVAAIESHEVLRLSAYSRLGEDSMSAIGAWLLLNDLVSLFDPEDYAKKLETGKLFTQDLLNDVSRDGVEVVGESGIVRWARETPWAQSAQSGTPRFRSNYDDASNLWLFEHADLFHDVLTQVFESFDQDKGFTTRVEAYNEFQIAYVQGSLGDGSNKAENLKELQQAWFHHANGYYEKDRASELFRTLCTDGLSEAEMLAFRAASDEERRQKFEALSDKMVKVARELSEYIIAQSGEDEFEKRRNAELNLAQLDKDARDWKRFIDSKGIQAFSCDLKKPTFQDAASFRSFMQNYENPYLSQANREAHHGTHVSGIVASQSERNLIVPVRVTTQSVLTSQDEREQIISDFLVAFADWLETPVVKRGAEKLFLQAFPDASSWAEAKTLFLEAATPSVRDAVMSSPLEFVFIGELVDAITWVGKKKIKIANVSLGTSFAAAQANPELTDPKRLVPGMLSFLKFEYYKNVLGRTIREHASETLFVVAAGNNGQWADGRSRSALPCDLSSSYFAAFEDPAKGERLANNEVDNILCVGSINPSDEISSFSNLPITKVPFVLSYGEAVLSTIRSGNCDGTDQDYALESPRTALYSVPFDSPEVEDILRRHGFLEGEADFLQVFRASRRMEALLKSVFTDSRESAKQTKCVTEDKRLARLSGTSMASPAVAGVLGRLLYERQTELGVSPVDVWADARFAPMELINLLRNRSPEYGGESLIAQVKKVIDVRSWTRALSGHSLLAGTLPGDTNMVLMLR